MTDHKKRWPSVRLLIWAAIALLSLIAGWNLLSDYYGEEEKALRIQLREKVKEKFPDRSAAFLKTFGLYSFATSEAISKNTVTSDAGIVLVHGLDDPGKVWRSLAPELLEKGHQVWLMNYPNDQPVGASADLLFKEFEKIKSFGVHQVSIVARMKRRLIIISIFIFLILVVAVLFFYRPTRQTLERAEAFQFRRMLVAKLDNTDECRRAAKETTSLPISGRTPVY